MKGLGVKVQVRLVQVRLVQVRLVQVRLERMRLEQVQSKYLGQPLFAARAGLRSQKSVQMHEPV